MDPLRVEHDAEVSDATAKLYWRRTPCFGRWMLEQACREAGCSSDSSDHGGGGEVEEKAVAAAVDDKHKEEGVEVKEYEKKGKGKGRRGVKGRSEKEEEKEEEDEKEKMEEKEEEQRGKGDDVAAGEEENELAALQAFSVDVCAGYPHSVQLAPLLHRWGVNVRMLGRIYRSLDTPVAPPSEERDACRLRCREVLLVEMVARVLKQIIRERHRQYSATNELPREERYQAIVVDTLNEVLSLHRTRVHKMELILQQQVDFSSCPCVPLSFSSYVCFLVIFSCMPPSRRSCIGASPAFSERTIHRMTTRQRKAVWMLSRI
jgi:hypothetical protein